MKRHQFKLFDDKVDLSFGGSKLLGKRKTVRPLSSKKPLHLVLKASNANLLLRSRPEVLSAVSKYARSFGVKIYEVAVQADHVRLLILIPSRELYRRWIRAFSSALTFRVPGLKWKLRPFTRVSSWGCEFKTVRSYIQRNTKVGNFIVEAHCTVDDWLQNIKFEPT